MAQRYYDSPPDTAFTSGDNIIQIDLSEAIRRIRVLNITHMRDKFRVEVANAARTLWADAVTGSSLAGMTYPVHDPKYAQAISGHNAVQMLPDGVVLDPNYEKADLYENGFDDYDMKPGFLANAKHTSKEGNRYAIVPFRHLTPGSTGEGVKAATIMPQEVYDVAETLEEDESILQDSGAITKPQLSTMSDSYTHTASVYQGMKKYGKRGMAQYLTFRTVSEKSDENSWHRPGMPPNHIVEAVKDELDQNVLPKILLRLIGSK